MKALMVVAQEVRWQRVAIASGASSEVAKIAMSQIDRNEIRLGQIDETRLAQIDEIRLAQIDDIRLGQIDDITLGKLKSPLTRPATARRRIT